MSAVIRRVLDLVNAIGIQTKRTANVILPPAQREQILNDVRMFASRNPKLATFIALQFLFAAVPFTFFTIFAISTLLICISTCLFALVTCAVICISLTMYFIFIALAIGFCVLVPSLAIGCFMATCSFVWCLAAWVILRWFNNGQEPTTKDTKIGNAVRGVGGRLGLVGEQTGESGVGEKEVKGNRVYDNDSKSNKKTHGHGDGGEWEAKWKHGEQQNYSDMNGSSYEIEAR